MVYEEGSIKMIFYKFFTSKDNIIEILTFLLICIVISILHEHDSAADQTPFQAATVSTELLLENQR